MTIDVSEKFTEVLCLKQRTQEIIKILEQHGATLIQYDIHTWLGRINGEEIGIGRSSFRKGVIAVQMTHETYEELEEEFLEYELQLEFLLEIEEIDKRYTKKH